MHFVVHRISPSKTNWVSLALASFFFAVSPVQGETPDFEEYEIKAVFLYNLIQFVEWPPDVFSDSQSPIVIGVMGDDLLAQALERVVKDEKVRNRHVVVRGLPDGETANECHLLFIGESEKTRLTHIFRKTEHWSVLTVSDAEGFAEQGGAINCYFERNKLRFEINTEALKKAHLKANSQLLRLARIVNSGPGE